MFDFWVAWRMLPACDFCLTLPSWLASRLRTLLFSFDKALVGKTIHLNAEFCLTILPNNSLHMNDNSTILKKIRGAGVVGAGGAGFPTYKKVESQVDWIIANGAECEPLLQKDRETMRRDAKEMLRGLRIMQQLTGATRVTIAVKRKNEDVADQLSAAAEKLGF